MRRVYVAYAVLGLGLWPLPLLNVLQVESAAVVAFVSFFAAGWSAVSHFRAGGSSLWRELGRQEAALLIPLGLFLVAPLWAPNCTIGQGLLFYALFPGVTVILAVSVAYVLTGTGITRPTLALGGIGLLVSLTGPIYDLGFHPQLYTYNHVFGGVLGPIYDEQLAVRPGLFAFRGLTLLWAGTAALLGSRLRGHGPTWGPPLLALVIGVVYWFSASLGMNTPADHLQAKLGGHHRTPHFDLYYDPDHLEERAVTELAEAHEAAYAYLREKLAIPPGEGPDRIQSYLYPNRDGKARLTGARSTSVTPVWLDNPQVHLLVDRVGPSLGHELAHVFSRPYGLPFLRASWAPGLIEGWAVALEPPDPYPSAHDLVTVATATDSVDALAGKADAISNRLSPWGFWTGRSAVSYATMGSFVRFLLDTYGPEPLKNVYAQGNFEAVYGRSLSALATEWAEHLRERSFVSRAAHDVVLRRFTQPSLFEKDCPHYVPPHRQHLQAARRAARAGDSSAVDTYLRKALDAAPRYGAAHAVLARRRLARGHADSVRHQLDTLAVEYRSARLRRLQGDAHTLLGDTTAARRHYRRARARMPRYAHGSRMRLLLRAAAADVPEVVRILTDGTRAHRQAEALGALTASDRTLVRVWQALRFQDARRYTQADSVWQRVASPPASSWPRAWAQEWGLQRQVWQAEAAYRAGRDSGKDGALPRSIDLFAAAARRAKAHGAYDWAGVLGARAKRARGTNTARNDRGGGMPRACEPRRIRTGSRHAYHP